MATALSTLVEKANRYLGVARIQGYCPDGLQVEGRPQVRRIVNGVTASQMLLDAAVEADADVVLVHHDYFWRGKNPYVVGMKQRRLKTLLDNDINPLAYHLLLDLHPGMDNNVQLARQLGFEAGGPLEPGNPCSITLLGLLAELIQPADFVRHVRDALGHEPLLVDADQPIRHVAWCTSDTRGYINQTIAVDVDVYLTGEVSERTVHSVWESGISFIAAEHHAAERCGVQALGDYLDKRFVIRHLFIDCPNPA